jgi:hypothetical protein
MQFFKAMSRSYGSEKIKTGRREKSGGKKGQDIFPENAMGTQHK